MLQDDYMNIFKGLMHSHIRHPGIRDKQDYFLLCDSVLTFGVHTGVL